MARSEFVSEIQPFTVKVYKEKVPTFTSQRFILAYMFFFGYFCIYAVRVNLSVAIVCMIKTPLKNDSVLSSAPRNGTQDLDSNQCGKLESNNGKINERAEFDWDKNTRSNILSSFFYGYIMTQVAGGWLADRFGGKRIFGVAMSVCAVSTILLPVCARTSVILIYILRIINGLASGVVFPVGHSMWGRWAPRFDRSKLVAISFNGTWVGIIFTFGTSGLLCEYGFDNGWGSIFYVTGGLCCVWLVVWCYQASDSPSQHPRISQAELKYIESNIEYDTNKKVSNVPWKAMFSSVVLWVGIVTHMCSNWGIYILIISLPAFMKEVLKFDIKSNGLLSALPYICSIGMALVAGFTADFLRSRKYLTTAQTRKLFQSVAMIGAGTFMVATGFVSCEKRYLAVVFLCLAVTLKALVRGGFSVNHVDVAPKYAGIMLGITNTMGTIPGVVSPIAVGLMTPNGSQEEWRNVFYLCAGIYLFGTIIFGCFGRGEVQSWAKDKNIAVHDEEQSKTKINTSKSKM